MYIQGFLVPVPAEKKDTYREVAEKFWPIARDYGCTAHVEAWEADIKDGQHTDFRRAVDLQEGEKVVFSWMIWPDRKTSLPAGALTAWEYGPTATGAASVWMIALLMVGTR